MSSTLFIMAGVRADHGWRKVPSYAFEMLELEDAFCISVADEVPVIVADWRCIDELDRRFVALVWVIDGEQHPLRPHHAHRAEQRCRVVHA